jgi:hypothetical protein
LLPSDPFKFKVQMELALHPPLRGLPRTKREARANLVAEYVSQRTKVSLQEVPQRLEQANRIIGEVKGLLAQYAKNMIWRSSVTQFLDVLRLALGSFKLIKSDIENSDYPLKKVETFENTVLSEEAVVDRRSPEYDHTYVKDEGLSDEDAVLGDPLKHLRIHCMRHPDLENTLRRFFDFLKPILAKDKERENVPKEISHALSFEGNLTVAGPNMKEGNADKIGNHHPGILHTSRSNAAQSRRLKASAIEHIIGRFFDICLETKLNNVMEDLMRFLKDKEKEVGAPATASTAATAAAGHAKGHTGHKRAQLLALPFAKQFLLFNETFLNTGDWTTKLMPPTIILLKQDRVPTPRELWALQYALLQKIHLRCREMIKYSLFSCNEPPVVCDQIMPFILQHFGVDAGRQPPQHQMSAGEEQLHWEIQTSTTAWLLFLKQVAKIKGLPLTYREWDSSEIASTIRYQNNRHFTDRFKEMTEAFNVVLLDGKEAGGGYDAKLRRYFDDLFNDSDDDINRPKPSYDHDYFKEAYVVLLVMQGLHELMADCSAIPPPPPAVELFRGRN